MTINTILARHITDPVLPDQLPVGFAMRGHTSHDDPFARFLPGLEGSVLLTRDPYVEIGFFVHAIADADYLGQWMFVQVCRRTDRRRPFGDWHFGFYYLGGDSSWDQWQLDLNHGDLLPSYSQFGVYVDEHITKEKKS